MSDSLETVAGFHAVLAALESSDAPPSEVLLARHRQDERSRRVCALAQSRGVPLRRVERQALDLQAPGVRHQGVVALRPRRAPDAGGVLEADAPPDGLMLVLDGVQDPHNLGACLRSAEAAGALAVLAPKDRAAGLGAGARRAAAGAAERIPLVPVTNLARALRQLRQRGWWLTGLDGTATATLYEAKLDGPVALVLGAEETGLRRLTREACDQCVSIPMAGAAASLNVSVAAAVSMYEVVRRRVAVPQGRR